MQKLIMRIVLASFLLGMMGLSAAFARPMPRGAQATDTTKERSSIDLSIRDFSSKYSSGKWDSAANAQQAVSLGEQLELQVQQYFSNGERACSERFFVNSCVDDLRLQRRSWQDQIRSITQAAKAYMRQAKSKRVD